MTETVQLTFREGSERREALLVVEYPGSSRYSRTFEGEEAERLWAEFGRLIGGKGEAGGDEMPRI
jgi:hypothetical protein